LFRIKEPFLPFDPSYLQNNRLGKLRTGTAIFPKNPAARITPESYRATPELTDDITTGSPQNRKKFTVPPQKVTVGSENWNVF